MIWGRKGEKKEKHLNFVCGAYKYFLLDFLKLQIKFRIEERNWEKRKEREIERDIAGNKERGRVEKESLMEVEKGRGIRMSSKGELEGRAIRKS